MKDGHFWEEIYCNSKYYIKLSSVYLGPIIEIKYNNVECGLRL